MRSTRRIKKQLEAKRIKRSVDQLARALREFDLLGAKRFPCGEPFVTPGLGAVIIPPPGIPGPGDLVLAETRARRDSQDRAQAICDTNPDCPNASFLFFVLGPRFSFLPMRPGGALPLFCRLVAMWICVKGKPRPMPDIVPPRLNP